MLFLIWNRTVYKGLDREWNLKFSLPHCVQIFVTSVRTHAKLVLFLLKCFHKTFIISYKLFQQVNPPVQPLLHFSNK